MVKILREQKYFLTLKKKRKIVKISKIAIILQFFYYKVNFNQAWVKWVFEIFRRNKKKTIIKKNHLQ